MEVAVGVVASFIAIVTLAAQSAKITHTTLRTIKDGPPATQKLITAVLGLEGLLSHFKRLGNQAEKVLASEGECLFTEARPLLQDCADDMQQIRRELANLQKVPGEGLPAKTKRTAKTFLMAQDFENWWNVVHSHITILDAYMDRINIALSLINLEGLDLIHGAVVSAPDVTHKLNGIETLISIHAIAGKSQLERHMQLLTQQVKTTQKAVKSHHLATTAAFNEALIYLRRLRTNVEVSSEQHIDGLQQAEKCTLHDQSNPEIEDHLERTIENRFQNLYEIAIECQSGTTLVGPKVVKEGLIQLIDTLVPQIEKDTRAQSAARSLPREAQRSLNSVQETRTIINRNGDFDAVNAIELEIDTNKEPKSPITWINEQIQVRDDDVCPHKFNRSDPIIGHINEHRQHGTSNCITVPRDRKRRTENERALGNPLTWKRQLKGASKISPVHEILQRDSGVFSAEFPAGAIVIHFKKRYNHVNPFQRLFPTITKTAIYKELIEAKVTLIPRSSPSSKQQITVTYRQQEDQNNKIAFSHIAFRRIIPDDHFIWASIYRGDLEEISDAIRSGVVRITDHNTVGCSLLGYALESFETPVVKYLIKQGADVEAVERSHSTNHYQPITRKFIVLNSHPSYWYKDIEVVEICRILLEAGADPLQAGAVEESGYMHNSFVRVLCYGSLGAMKTLLDHGHPFISPEYIGDNDCDLSPLHFLVKYFLEIPWHQLRNSFVEKTIMLLNRGANPNAGDRFHNTCLHKILAFKDAYDVEELETLAMWLGENRGYDPFCRRKDLKDMLMLLVLSGADVTAVNDRNLSVSDIAEANNNIELWREVLEDCGFDTVRSKPAAVYSGDSSSSSSGVDYESGLGFRHSPSYSTNSPDFHQYLQSRKQIFHLDPSDDELYEDMEAMERSKEFNKLQISESGLEKRYQLDRTYSFRWTDPRTGILTSTGSRDPRVRDFLAHNGPINGWRRILPRFSLEESEAESEDETEIRDWDSWSEEDQRNCDGRESEEEDKRHHIDSVRYKDGDDGALDGAEELCSDDEINYQRAEYSVRMAAKGKGKAE